MTRPFKPRPITEADVREALLRLGNDVLADYDAGRITGEEAYAMTRRGLAHADALRRARRTNK